MRIRHCRRALLPVAASAGVFLITFPPASAAAQPVPPAESPTTTLPIRSEPPLQPLEPDLPPLPGGVDDAPAGEEAPPDSSRKDPCSDLGWFDLEDKLKCRVSSAITEWFQNLVADALEPVLDLLARTLFTTPDPSVLERTRALWRTSAVMANGIFVLLVTVGGFILMGYETIQTSYALKDLLPRIAIGWVVANLSLWFAGHAVRLANDLSSVFLATAAVDDSTALVGMKNLGLSALGGGASLPVVLLLLAVLVLAVGLLGAYVLRVATVFILAAAAPLALCLYALPQTAGAARVWWRAFVGCLTVQVAQAFVLAVALRVLFDADGQRNLGGRGSGVMDVVMVGALFWLMLKLPGIAGKYAFTGGGSGHPVARTVGYYALGRRLGRGATPSSRPRRASTAPGPRSGDAAGNE